MREVFLLLLIITLPLGTLEQNSCACKKPDDWQTANICYEVFNELSRALLSNKANLYRMKQAFFYAPSADPVLVQVNYTISYGDNITEDQLQYCESVTNETAIITNQSEIILGWTSRGVYYVVSPSLLNNMQMVLPYAILRFINQRLRSTYGSPEVDTFLWDGSYELPTLRINLTITSLPCIPSVEVFNCTLKELNAYLKTYAKSQDSQPAAIHADDIAYTLSEDHMLLSDDNSTISTVISVYCTSVYILIIMFELLLLMIIATKGKKAISDSTHRILEHKEFIISAMLVGFLLVISEFLTTTVYHIIKDFLKYTIFHFLVWIFVVFGIILFPFALFIYAFIKVKIKFVTFLLFIMLLFLIYIFLLHICFYALPTLLFLLVYPTKVITVLAYMITFIFVVIITFSILMHVSLQRYQRLAQQRERLPLLYTAAFIVIYYIGLVVVLFAILIIFLYALVLGEASAISVGAYTVLSLIPTAAISIVSWMFKNRVFSNTKMKESDKKNNENVDEEQSATDNGEALTVFVNENTPINGNDQEVETYGAADNN